MTHMTNYGNDQLALYTVSRLVNFVHRWTNLELKYAEPTELADIYFNLFPKDKVPVWLVSYIFIFVQTKKHCHVLTIPNCFCVGTKTRPDRASFTFTSGNFGAISVTERSFASPISNVECHVSDRFCAALWSSVNRYSDWSGSENKRGLESTERKVMCEDWDLVHQTLSANCSGTMFNVCERLVPVLCRCWSYYTRTAFRVGVKSYPV